MSHTTKVENACFTSGKHLRRAVEALAAKGINCEIIKDAVPRMWFQDQWTKQFGDRKADFVVRLPDCRFDVGFIREGKKLVPVFDPHAGLIAEHLGSKGKPNFESKNHLHHIRALTSEYLFSVQKEALELAGYETESIKRDDDGKITIIANVKR